MDHPGLILLPSADRAALSSWKPLKGLHTSSVENMRARQQHLKESQAQKNDIYTLKTMFKPAPKIEVWGSCVLFTYVPKCIQLL